MIVKTINRIISNPIFNSIREKNKSKIFIYPNWNGIGLGFFVLCFLVAVFYEINFSLLLSIILFLFLSLFYIASKFK